MARRPEYEISVFYFFKNGWDTHNNLLRAKPTSSSSETQLGRSRDSPSRPSCMSEASPMRSGQAWLMSRGAHWSVPASLHELTIVRGLCISSWPRFVDEKTVGGDLLSLTRRMAGQSHVLLLPIYDVLSVNLWEQVYLTQCVGHPELPASFELPELPEEQSSRQLFGLIRLFLFILSYSEAHQPSFHHALADATDCVDL